jgi:hypothetical protein
MATLYRIVNEEPPRPRDPGWLAPVFEATMTKDPAARWTMAQVRDFLVTRTLPTAPPAFVPAPAHDAAPTVAMSPLASRRRSPWPWVAAAVVIAASLLAVFLVSRNQDQGTAAARHPATRTATSHPSSGSAQASGTPTTTPSTTPSTTPAAPSGRPSAAAMRAFVVDYLRTVTSSPAQAWGRLTPQFQATSGGFRNYRGFWSTISAVQPHDIVADPAGHSVSYAVDYTRTDGSRSTEQVTLRLTGSGEDLRIAGEG